LKQLHSNWVQLETFGQIERVSFRLAYIINIWANYNSPNQNWPTETTSFKFGQS